MGFTVDDVFMKVSFAEQERFFTCCNISLTLKTRFIINWHVVKAWRGLEIGHIKELLNCTHIQVITLLLGTTTINNDNFTSG